MKKKRTISKNRSSYKKKIKRSKSKRKKRTKTKSRTKTIETTELMKWIQGKTKKKTRKKTRKKSKKKSKTYRKRVKRGGSAPTPANSPRRRGEAEALEEEELRQPEVVGQGLGSIEEGQEGQAQAQAQAQAEEEEVEYEDEGGEPLPQYIPPVDEPVEVRQPEVAAEGLALVEQQPGVPPRPSEPPPSPPVEGEVLPAAMGGPSARDHPSEETEAQAQAHEQAEYEDEDAPPPAPPRPGERAQVVAGSTWIEITRGNQPPIYFNELTQRSQEKIPEEGINIRISEEEYERRQARAIDIEEEAAGSEAEEEAEEEADVSQGEPITQRTPEEEEEEKSLWKKLKTFVQGTEYEQFIQEMGKELKELFTEYLTGYFEDIENEEDVDFLRAKYESFIDAYYKKAIAKDRELIEKLKGEGEGEEEGEE